MSPVNFAYWLMGFFEISGAKELNEAQVEMIKNHLNLVFVHSIDPAAAANLLSKVDVKVDPKQVQKVLNEIHKPHDPNTVYRC